MHHMGEVAASFLECSLADWIFNVVWFLANIQLGHWLLLRCSLKVWPWPESRSNITFSPNGFSPPVYVQLPLQLQSHLLQNCLLLPKALYYSPCLYQYLQFLLTVFGFLLWTACHSVLSVLLLTYRNLLCTIPQRAFSNILKKSLSKRCKLRRTAVFLTGNSTYTLSPGSLTSYDNFMSW